MKVDVVVDIGNTRMKWGQCAAGQVRSLCALPPDEPAAWEDQFTKWQIHPDQQWVLAGVHPARLEVFAQWLKNRCGSPPHIIRSLKQIPVRVRVDFPEKVGLDRLFNALAVNGRRPAGRPAVVVDAGSAVTVDYLDDQGTFLGGAIMPGLRLMAQALASGTAQLPVVELRRRWHFPETATDRAIELGVFHAVLGGIASLIRDLPAQSLHPLPVFFGGGDVALLAPHLPWPVTIWPEMTLEGIRLAGEQLA